MCSKDSYPLPRIDHLVDTMFGHKRHGFLDVFSRYHQISMVELNQEKTFFIIDYDTYYYIVVSFDMKMQGRLIKECEQGLSEANRRCYKGLCR